MSNNHEPNELEAIVNAAWEARDGISAATKGAVREAVDAALALLDLGKQAARCGIERVVEIEDPGLDLIQRAA